MRIPLLADVSVKSLQCESRHQPLGVDDLQPRLSWMIESTGRNQAQSAYRVLVASSEETLTAGSGDLWDSGKVMNHGALGIPYNGKPLRSGQRCHWKVRVWDKEDHPSRFSEPSWWEMGLLQSGDWKGLWINDGKSNPTHDAEFYADDPAPLFRREFKLEKPTRRARFYISGLGCYEASLNGSRIGDQVLDPGWTTFGQRVFYSSFDVGARLHVGNNCLGVTLGNGWWNPLPLRLWGQRNLRDNLAVGRPRFIAQLNIEFMDGTTRSYSSDTTWKVADGPLRRNSIYLGEVYDGRLERRGWNQTGYDDSAWRAPRSANESIGPLQAQPQPPIRIRETFPAVRVTEPKPGTFIYDLGRNFSGWAGLSFQAPAGTELVLRYGELLNPDGSLNPLTSVCGQIKGTRRNQAGTDESIGGPGAPNLACQTDICIAAGGGEEHYAPRFTFHGFRYVEVTGLTAALPLKSVTGICLSSDVPDVGEFSCSNPMLNQIQTMCQRTFLSNLFSVQSDCPHRERLGYGGDIAATSEAFLMNFDMATFYAKTVRDFADAARPDGRFTDTSPFVGIDYCGVGWAMAHPLLLEQLHTHYGNRRLLDEQLPKAIRWLDGEAARRTDGLVTHGLGDHEALARAGGPVLTTPMFIDSARRIARLSRICGRTDDAARCETMADESATAWAGKFLNPATGEVGGGSQSEQALALGFGASTQAARPAVFARMVDQLNANSDGPRLTTGIFGTRFLLEELSRNDRSDLAYGLTVRKTIPSWGWMIAKDATTLWEHWAGSDNTYSHNHPMFGSVSAWFFRWLGGIQPAPDAVGFDRIVICPQLVPGLQWVRCTHLSIRGPIKSNWAVTTAGSEFEIVIPPDTTAIIELPANKGDLLTESGHPIAASQGITPLPSTRFLHRLKTGSGTYFFKIRRNVQP